MDGMTWLERRALAVAEKIVAQFLGQDPSQICQYFDITGRTSKWIDVRVRTQGPDSQLLTVTVGIEQDKDFEYSATFLGRSYYWDVRGGGVDVWPA